MHHSTDTPDPGRPKLLPRFQRRHELWLRALARSMIPAYDTGTNSDGGVCHETRRPSRGRAQSLLTKPDAGRDFCKGGQGCRACGWTMAKVWTALRPRPSPLCVMRPCHWLTCGRSKEFLTCAPPDCRTFAGIGAGWERKKKVLPWCRSQHIKKDSPVFSLLPFLYPVQ
jgi:hypothetical protein